MSSLLTHWPPANPKSPLAVLVSGGIDSATMLAEAVAHYPAVHPIYVKTGSHWEPTEFAYLQKFLTAIRAPSLRPCVVLHQPVDDLYDSHWSVTGQNVPDASCPDESVYLPGRNVLLLSKPLLWCHLNGVPEVATAPLAGNPFPDATVQFYTRFAEVVSEAVAGHVRVLRPYADAGFNKVDVLRRGAHLPLELTFSCIEPRDGLNCGRCCKCGERVKGFLDAKMPDPTRYAQSPDDLFRQ